MVSQSNSANKPAISGPRQQAWIRALERARLVATRKPTYIPQRDTFRVYSARAGNTYNVYPVEVDGHITYKCDCQGGERGLVCWHAALIAALPQEVARRAKHRAQRQVERDVAQRAPAKNGHELLMECFE